jgi:hypothetical protein
MRLVTSTTILSNAFTALGVTMLSVGVVFPKMKNEPGTSSSMKPTTLATRVQERANWVIPMNS